MREKVWKVMRGENKVRERERMIERPPRGQSREDSLQLSYNTILIMCQKVMVENTESRFTHTYTQINSLTQKHIPHRLTFWGSNKPNKPISAYR